MNVIHVYEATVWVGPNVHGWVYSFRPIPHCVYPAGETSIDGHAVQFNGCNRYVIEAPDGVSVTKCPDGDTEWLSPDPEAAPGQESGVGPRVVLDRASLRPESGFKLLKVNFEYWRWREATRAFESTE